jgi:hypothetical protein
LGHKNLQKEGRLASLFISWGIRVFNNIWVKTLVFVVFCHFLHYALSHWG